MSGLSQDLHQKLIAAVQALTPQEGYSRTAISEVKLLRVDEAMSHTPVLYEPCIVIVLQGRKVAIVGGQEYIYDPQHYLVLSVPLPFTSETVASPESPLLALSISLNLTTIAEILCHLDVDDEKAARSVTLQSSPLEDDLGSALLRLITAASDANEAKIIGPGLLKEFYYRVLIGEQGKAMRAALSNRGHFGQIANAIRTIHTGFNYHIDVSSLAKQAGMSAPAFHLHFKSYTGTTPIQYLKSTRLHQARFLMVKGGVTAADASARVGYESPSQFNREFKRFFGHSPLKEAQRLRHLLKVKAETFWPD